MKKNKNSFAVILVLTAVILFSCDKKERPALGDYPKDATAPGGPLKFYAAFDGTTANPLLNAVDSIKANFAALNPLTEIDGISGKAVKGVDGMAIKYVSANDFGKNTTSFTIAFWVTGALPTNGAQFAFSLTDKDYWANSAMFLLFDNGGATTDSAVIKFHIFDDGGEHWFELVGDGRMYKLYDGNWHQLVFSYDETSSDMKVYKDGQLTNTLNWAGHGQIKFNGANVGNLILGGFNKHAGVEGPTDDWMTSWQGGLDQFRMYNTVLTASEVLALYNSKL